MVESNPEAEGKKRGIPFDEIEYAYIFASDGEEFGNEAYVAKKEGRIYYSSLEVEIPEEDQLPELLVGDEFIPIPRKRELDLGKMLVLEFTYRYLPDHAEEVEYFFRRRGAYRRFKALLDELGELDHWYRYENEATRNALMRWCKENDIQVLEK